MVNLPWSLSYRSDEGKSMFNHPIFDVFGAFAIQIEVEKLKKSVNTLLFKQIWFSENIDFLLIMGLF